MKNAVNTSWPNGIQKIEEKVVSNIPRTDIKLIGTPWFSTGSDSVNCRKLIATIVQNLSGIGWKFHACVNLTGGSDSLFFIFEPHEVDIYF